MMCCLPRRGVMWLLLLSTDGWMRECGGCVSVVKGAKTGSMGFSCICVFVALRFSFVFYF